MREVEGVEQLSSVVDRGLKLAPHVAGHGRGLQPILGLLDQREKVGTNAGHGGAVVADGELRAYQTGSPSRRARRAAGDRSSAR